jgi:tetratricopeptide (TPR) repeat protein
LKRLPIVVLVTALCPVHAEEPCRNQVVGSAVRLLGEGAYARAQKLLSAALQDTEQFGVEEPCTATAWNDLGVAYHGLGREYDAERCLKHAIRIWRSIGREDDPVFTRTANNLATVYVDTGHSAKAERTGIRFLAARLESMQPNDPQIATLLITVGALDRAQKRYPEAEHCFLRALAVVEKLNPQNIETMAVLSNLGRLYGAWGRSREAHSYLERALSIGEKTLGPEHPALATLLANLGTLHEPAEAEGFYKRALSISESTVGTGHPKIAQILNGYAKALRQMKRNTEAQAVERRSRAIRETASREDIRAYSVDVSDLRKW